MDELTVLAEMRKDAAPPDTTYPAAHRALLAEISGKSGRAAAPSRRRRRPILVSGLAAGTLAAGAIAVAVTPGAGHHAPSMAGTTAPPGLVAVTSPMALAANAVSVAQRAPIPAPTQWFYVKMEAAYPKPAAPFKAGPHHLFETWTRVDMQKSVVVTGGQKFVNDHGEGDPRGWPTNTYSYLNSLPTHPDALLKLIRHYWTLPKITGPNGGPTDEHVFLSVTSLMEKYPVLPPRLNAALYGVLARLKGVHLERDRDFAGRRVLSLYIVTLDGQKMSILINPASYAYDGQRTIAVRDQSYRGVITMHRGDLLQDTAILVSKIVKSPGARS